MCDRDRIRLEQYLSHKHRDPYLTPGSCPDATLRCSLSRLVALVLTFLLALRTGNPIAVPDRGRSAIDIPGKRGVKT